MSFRSVCVGVVRPDQIDGNHGNTVFVVQNCMAHRMKRFHATEKEEIKT